MGIFFPKAYISSAPETITSRYAKTENGLGRHLFKSFHSLLPYTIRSSATGSGTIFSVYLLW